MSPGATVPAIAPRGADNSNDRSNMLWNTLAKLLPPLPDSSCESESSREEDEKVVKVGEDRGEREEDCSGLEKVSDISIAGCPSPRQASLRKTVEEVKDDIITSPRRASLRKTVKDVDTGVYISPRRA